MNLQFHRLRRGGASLLAFVGLVAGCGFGAGEGTDPLAPDLPVARPVLERALRAWVAGEAFPLKMEGHTIQLTDHDHRVGQRLEEYEVLGAHRADRFATFVVRLYWKTTGENKTAPDTVEYMVAGQEPIWVLRRDEFEMLLHWEHPMDAATTSVGSANESQPAAHAPGGIPIEAQDDEP